MIAIPPALAATQRADGGAWVRNLPGLVAGTLDRWSLRIDGPVGHGMAGLVLPVVRAAGLRTWAGRDAVLLLDHDETTGAMLLKRLDAARPLSALPDDAEALTILAGLLARLTAVRCRFDQLTETLALDRDRATGWTLARILQNSLWDIEDGNTALDPVQLTIAQALTPGHRESRVHT